MLSKRYAGIVNDDRCGGHIGADPVIYSRWPLPDGFDEFLRGVERGSNTAIAPELLAAEAANVIHKKRNSGELNSDESGRLLTVLLGVPIRLFPHWVFIEQAFEIAWDHDLTVYDALYLSLAETHGAIVFSADRKLLTVVDQLRLR